MHIIKQLNEHRKEIEFMAEGMAAEIAVKDSEINAIFKAAGIDNETADEIYQLILEVSNEAFAVGCHLGSALYQIRAGCDSLVRDYGELAEKAKDKSKG
jgi:hypothetical protein